MGDPRGFLKVKRETSQYRPVHDRVDDYKDVTLLRSHTESERQASRCMDCGTPFCHWGCPVGNCIPEWNDLVYHKKWKRAYELLSSTNNFPEFTGRLCPAICEYACVLGINDDPVTIRENELAIIEYAFKNGYVKSAKTARRTGKKVAVIGSGPAGLAAADQLNKAGHKVTVLERDEAIGGILRLGIPDFKIEKWVIERRVDLMKKEGVTFKVRCEAGPDYPADKLIKDFDAVVLSGGSRVPRDLPIEGRELGGIHFAMDFLMQSNRWVATGGDKKHSPAELINAKGKRVVVIGGGDTGADCVGTSHRQGASKVTQIEVMPMPSKCRTEDMPWPRYPMLLKTSTSHEEGGVRDWAVLTKRFVGENGMVKRIDCIRVDFPGKDNKGCPIMRDVPGTEFSIDADLVILAVGFTMPLHKGLLDSIGLEYDQRGNVKTGDDKMSSKKGVFAAGDMRRGQSLIVWAIAEGRTTAHFVDKYLMGASDLPLL